MFVATVCAAILGVIGAIAAGNGFTLISEIFFPLQYPKDEGPEQAARWVVAEWASILGLIAGSVLGLFIAAIRLRPKYKTV
jgi:MFS family permease